MYGRQMDMFQEGGVTLKDEGGEVEKTSGNEVPLGGVKEGVADDQPANLSAGEMVLSEDVVRYHGVEKVMALRDEAKIGYHKMEAMGQLGNADEATIPTEAIFNPGGMPFSVVDLEYIDMDDDVDEAEAANGMYVQDMQTGGVVQSLIDPATGLPRAEAVPGVAPTSVSTPNVPTNIVNLPGERFPNPFPQIGNQPQIGTPLAGSQPGIFGQPISSATGINRGLTNDAIFIPPSTPTVITPSAPITQQPTGQGQPTLPTTNQFFGGAGGTNFFINEAGQIIQIPVINGRQIYPTPEGFQPHDPQDPKPFDPDLEEKEEETPVDVPSTLQQPPPDVGAGEGGFGNFAEAFEGGAATYSGGSFSDMFSDITGFVSRGGTIGAIIGLISNSDMSDADKAAAVAEAEAARNAEAFAWENDKVNNPTGATSSRYGASQSRINQQTEDEFRSRKDRIDAVSTEGGPSISAPTGTAAGIAETGGMAQGFADVEGFPETGGRPAGVSSFDPTAAELAAGEAAGMAEGFGSAPDITPESPDSPTFKKGGLIEAQTGTLVPTQQPSATFSRINPETGLPETTAAPASATTPVSQPGTPAPITTGSALTPTTLSALTPTGTRVSAPDRPVGQQPPTTTPLPTGGQFLGGVQSTNFFINELGQVIQIPVVNGKQIYDEPKGFQPYDPSNPTPFDPNLEDDRTVTDPEQPPQRRRTVTDREGGQPDVGSPDAPGGDVPDAEPGTIDSATVDQLSEAKTPKDLEQIAFSLNLDINTMLDAVEERSLVERFTPFTETKDALANARGIAEKDAKDQFEQQQEMEDQTFSRSFDPDVVEGFGPEDYGEGTPGEDTGGIGGSGAGGGDYDSGLGFGGDFDAPEASTGTGVGEAGGTEVAKGGFIPKIKFKSKRKNRRKGLAQRK